MDTQPDMDAAQTMDAGENTVVETLDTSDQETHEEVAVQEESLTSEEKPVSEDAPTPEVEEAFSRFLRFWDLLVSTTNWEKGKIIHEWRESLKTLGAPVSVYSDEAWARRAGNVSPQHVGRLRRVHERFGEVHEEYSSLFWSHFQAALDWNDAEMWLEGAVQNKWSVAKMREQRWQAQGAPEKEKPKAEDVIVAEFDEDVSDANDGNRPDDMDDGPADGKDWAPGDEVDPDAADGMDGDVSPDGLESPADFADAPFDDLPPLPDDMADAVEAFKLAIIQHKLDGWKAITCGQVLQVLDGLRQVAMSSEEN